MLEAMSCGAPVIASNTTSIPEIVKIKDAQFDPKNVNNISEMIVKGLTNQSFRISGILFLIQNVLSNQ